MEVSVMSTLIKGKSNLEIARWLLEKHKELVWLTGSTQATPELGALPTNKSTIGELIFPGLAKNQLIELNRTFVGLFCFFWAFEDDYESFAACQTDDKISRATFERLVAYTKSVVRTSGDFEAMCVFLVINDLTKVVSIIEEMKKRTGTVEIDHDVVLYELLNSYPELSPSFMSLSAEHKRMILNGLGTKFNFGHLHQAEGPAAVLTGLKGLDQKSLDFFLIHAIFDTAGVVGHVRQDGSMSLTESGYTNLEAGMGAISYFRRFGSEEIAYERMLVERAKHWDLDVQNNQTHFATARIASMLRLGKKDKEKVRKILLSIESLSPFDQAILVKELKITGTHKDKAILIYYAPAIVSNAVTALKALGDSDPFKTACDIAVPTFVQVFKKIRPMVGFGSGSGLHKCMCRSVSEMAGTSPFDLLKSKFKVDPVGDDTEVTVI